MQQGQPAVCPQIPEFSHDQKGQSFHSVAVLLQDASALCMQAVVPRLAQLREASLIHFVITATEIGIPTLTGIVWLGSLIDGAAK